MKKNKALAAAVIISFTAHIIFLGVSPHIDLKGMEQFMKDSQRTFRVKEIKQRPEDVSLKGRKEKELHEVKMSGKDEGSLPGGVEPDLGSPEKKDLFLRDKQNELNESVFENKDIELDEKERERSLLETEEKKAQSEAAPEKQVLTDDLLSETFVRQEVDVISRPEPFSGNKMPADTGHVIFSPPAVPATPQAGSGIGEDMLISSEGPGSIPYEDMGGLLDIDLEKYRDPATGEKFFKLTIGVKEDVRLKVLPKEILFLIDSSKSITPKKLYHLKQGLVSAMKELNKGDRFNLIAFRGDLLKFRPGSVLYTDRTEQEGIEFINDLEAVGQTDVSGALYDMVLEPIALYPSYIILVSDGRPTTGMVDSRRIIQRITKENNRKRPVFAFAGGSRINRYLLEFVAYQNRGWSVFAPSTFDIEEYFIDFHRQINEPVLVNVRYLMLGVDIKQIYPRYLPDFFHQRSLEIFGKYGAEKEFSMQLLGEAEGSTKELVFRKSFDEAVEGSRSIARKWAFRKIYYLISRNTMGVGDPARMRKEIEELSRRFSIKTPYNIQNGE